MCDSTASKNQECDLVRKCWNLKEAPRLVLRAGLWPWAVVALGIQI